MQINLNNINYTYNKGTVFEKKVLKNISLKLKKRAYNVIVGKTGSGKSTLIEHINGLLVPNNGEVIVGETIISYPKNKREKKELAKRLREIRKDVAILFQFSEQQLFETTVLKDIIFAPLNYGISEKEAIERAKELISLVGLDESYLEKSPFELSGGEMRRVALCGVLALEPKVLILDEPTVALDYRSREEIMDMVKTLQKEKKMTIVLVTHNMDYVLKYADIVHVINSGEIAFSGLPEELFSNKELLKDNSLELPEILKFYYQLKEQNIDVGLFPREYRELTDSLKNMIKRKKENE